MRSVRLLALAGVAVSLAATSPAGAVGAGAHTDLVGSAAVSESFRGDGNVSTPTVAALNGHCTYARHAVGIEGSGVSFTLAGAGAATGTWMGIPIVATGVECHLYKPDMTIVSGPEFLPGNAAATTRTASSNNATGGAICVRVWALLRQAAPDGRTLVSTSLQCH